MRIDEALKIAVESKNGPLIQRPYDMNAQTNDFPLATKSENQKQVSISLTQAYCGQIEKSRPVNEQSDNHGKRQAISKKDEFKIKKKCPLKEMLINNSRLDKECFGKITKITTPGKNETAKLSRSIPRCKNRAKTLAINRSSPDLQNGVEDAEPFDRKFSRLSGYNEGADLKKLELSLNFRKPGFVEMEGNPNEMALC